MLFGSKTLLPHCRICLPWTQPPPAPFYSQLCGTPAVTVTSKAVSQADSIQQYASGLQTVAAVQQKAVKSSPIKPVTQW